MKHHHAFGCPMFAIENDLAAGSSIPHWSPCAHLVVNLGSSPSHTRNIYLVLNLHTGCVSPQYHCQFDNFFETVRHSGSDVSVLKSGLTVMMQTPSMEYHDEVPRPSERMQFRSNPVVLSWESDNTIFFGDATDTPIFFDQHVQDFSNNQLSQRSMRAEWLLINLCSLLTTVQTSKMSLQVPEPVREEGYARCQELWQSQCHSKISTIGTRHTTWRCRPCVSTTTLACTTAILTSKIACVILSYFLQK